ncbi:hypothetical protein FNV43_RR09475 [Rhamnella rubrinervis]|uniref:Uncharacterized protein n=1 Tax=Rhamnella rubrinervis TaxID=2594499 RepID=A0A8K0MK09_9ROSA|nr:hypothetical protein FNV43_RR09475 [Rhamnella rubrinervis]
MTPVCPFVKATRPDDASSRKSSAEATSLSIINNNNKQQNQRQVEPKCPFGYDSQTSNNDNKQQNQRVVEPKCPLGYDSQTFKLGPLSCMICQALLFESSSCVPSCISRFKDCPLCGADIEKIEDNETLQSLVDRFIEGHARIKRSHVDSAEDEEEKEKAETQKDKRVIYEDAFRAQNIGSAKSRLSLCAEDIRDQLGKTGNTSELCSQLGAVLGMIGDCCRATGDAGSAVTHYEESVEFLSKLPTDDLEVTHTLSVSLNKVGDLKYYDGDLQAARSYYFRSLNVRRDAAKNDPNASQILDIAVSLAKVADVDRNLGNEDVAFSGFQEAIKLLESLILKPEEAGLEPRLLSVREFLKNQIAENQADQAL